MTVWEFVCHVGNIAIWLTPPVVGVALGGFLVQRFWVRRANESAFIEYITTELDTLVDETLDYWSLDLRDENEDVKKSRQEAEKLAQRIKGAFRTLTSNLRFYSDHYCKSTIDYTLPIRKIFRACTGGQFEVNNRPPDTLRFLSVVNAANQLRLELQQRRV